MVATHIPRNPQLNGASLHPYHYQRYSSTMTDNGQQHSLTMTKFGQQQLTHVKKQQHVSKLDLRKS